MDKSILIGSTEGQQTISSLFESSPPVLVEVRFPSSGTSPDWYLCEVEEDLHAITKRLSPGAELYLSSVWDLKSSKGTICLKKA